MSKNQEDIYLNNANLKVIILGAGLSNNNSTHTALKEVGDGSKILDWLIAAYTDLDYVLEFIAGYSFEDLKMSYPNFLYTLNNQWEKTGATGSLFKAKLYGYDELIVSYSDILYRRDLVKKIRSNNYDVTIVIDTFWKNRYAGRTIKSIDDAEKINLANEKITRLGKEIKINSADGEFIGLVSFKGKGLKAINELQSESNNELLETNLSELIEQMRIDGLDVHYVDVRGDWAEMDDPRDLTQFILGTKAQTLDRLSLVLKNSIILDQFTFDVHRWEKEANKIIDEILYNFPSTNIVVRSSALSEDGFDTANAGKYESILNVDSSIREKVISSIEKVLNSYSDENLNNQVLVQPMLKNIEISGVIFTRTLSKGSPYYVINYDDQTGRTDSITSGTSKNSKTLVIRRDKLNSLVIPNKEIFNLCNAVKEIEGLLNYDSLDIEFAIDQKKNIYILQVRPISVDHSDWKINDHEIYQCINYAEKVFDEHNKKVPFLLGENAIFGLMPDWNPAEIIGVNPGRLAFSLYQKIIMNDIWSIQRAEYGYRDVGPIQLLKSIAGRPYVDVRASINSFIPSDLTDKLAEKFVNFYINYLKDHPEYHDKLEFEILPTCFDLNFDKWQKRFYSNGFSDIEVNTLKQSLINITNRALGRNREFFLKLEKLENKLVEIKKESNPIRRAYFLLEECKKFGTLPFAHLARSAFVAISLLKSAEEKKIISTKAKDGFLNSLKTVSQKFTKQVVNLHDGKISLDEFLNEFGHIRPGTYDITKSSYREKPNKYIKPLAGNYHTEEKEKNINIWLAEKEKFISNCDKEGIDSKNIEEFMISSIEGREHAKFLFSKNLSLALDSITEFAISIGLSKEAVSHISWDDLYQKSQTELNNEDLLTYLLDISKKGENWKKLSSSIELPPLITKRTDFSWFFIPDSQPNFVSTSEITSKCIIIDDSYNQSSDLKDKIAIIPNADPGYEWLFGSKISGLITMYGGANSHMAIRAAEFNMPAAIGLGEKEYKKLENAKIICLDALNQRIEIIE